MVSVRVGFKLTLGEDGFLLLDLALTKAGGYYLGQLPHPPFITGPYIRRFLSYHSRRRRFSADHRRKRSNR